jgi:hypothetical protein
VENLTIKSDCVEDFEESLKRYILALDPRITSISKKKVFDDLQIKKDRMGKVHTLETTLKILRPGIKLVRSSKP